VRGDGHPRARGLAHHRLDQRRLELLVELQAVHPAVDELSGHGARLGRRLHGHADAGAVARPQAVDERPAGKEPRSGEPGGAALVAQGEDRVERAPDVAHRGDAVAQEQRIHPARLVVHVHVDQAGDHPLPARVDALGAGEIGGGRRPP
jgi:hypothetical protein